ncbi:L,D-transpeptidase family protein [Clostridium sp. DL1XJH146]
MSLKKMLGTLFLTGIIIIIISFIFINNKRVKNTFEDHSDLGAIDIDKQDLKYFENNIERKETLVKDYYEKGKDMELFYNEYDLELEDATIIIYKDKHVLELYANNKLIGRFRIYLGQSPIGDKEKEGDFKTPEGNYYICTINDKSKYSLFLGLSYPNIEDAKRGLENGLIDQNLFNQIEENINNKKQPLWNSPLGGAIGIHGVGTFKGNWKKDWTAGCIALNDEDIAIIGQYVKYGTEVEIRP